MAASLQKAMEEYNRGEMVAALETLGGVLERDRANAEAFILAATIHEQMDDRLNAAIYYAGAMDLTTTLRRDVGFRSASHFLAMGDNASALSVMLMLSRYEPDDVEVIHSLCSLYREAGDYASAMPYAERLAEIGESFGNLLNAGIVLSGAGRYSDAYVPLLKAYLQNQTERLAVSELFWCASNLCDFRMSGELEAQLKAGYASDEVLDIRENAFRSLFWTGDEAYQQKCALRTAELLLPPVSTERPPKRENRGRIRIGYASSDFFNHATMTLFAGVLAAHDRERFEIYGICYTPEANREGEMRDFFLDNVDYYIDILAMGDDEAAAHIRALDLDILVDLKGYTLHSRLPLFARRCAPVQVSYLGFPGSVSGAGIDYQLTDAIVTPPSSEPFYEETLLRLSPTYQCNSRQHVPVRRGRRGQYGLPETGTVFAVFHPAPKIRQPVFSAWLEVLRQVEGSVLWFGELPAFARANLIAAAEAAGIAPERLVFGESLPTSAHLDRFCEADIALDTAPCNGHTTTSDALWSGVPVITMRGTNFAGRVSESLLGAVGLSDLVADDLEGFVRLAVELAQDGARQSRLRQHLIDARETAPLFDTVQLTRQIEDHFTAILG